MHQQLKEEAEELEGNEVEAFMCHMQLHQCENQLLMIETTLASHEIVLALLEVHEGKMHQPARQTMLPV